MQQDPHHPGLESHQHANVLHRKVMRSRVNDNFRILWEWVDAGRIRLWRVGAHQMIDAVSVIRATPRAQWRFFSRDDETHGAIELESLVVSRDLPRPFKHVPKNILRLFGVPDNQLQAVKSLSDAEAVWELPLPENVQLTLLDILTNPDWTLEDLLDSRQLLYRTTVDQLEGYCEGRIKQLLLNLNEEQQSYVHIRANGPLLIKGVAGSGKTTIGLYRSHYLAQEIKKRRRMFGEDTRILLLTYTKTLTKALEQLYEELYGEQPYSLTVAGYKEWMKEQLRGNGIDLAEATNERRKGIMRRVQRMVAREADNARISDAGLCAFFLSEIDEVIRARMLCTFELYQSVERRGRGIRLSRDRQRPVVWRIYEAYQAELDRCELFDYADLARLVLKHCDQLPQYDVVIIDEAQDFPPSDLNLATRLIANYSELRSLTLLADPAQSIYYRGIPWKEGGINIQGRTRILAKNFRNTEQILEAARPIVEAAHDLRGGGRVHPAIQRTPQRNEADNCQLPQL